MGAVAREDLMPQQVLHQGTESCSVCVSGVDVVGTRVAYSAGSGNNQYGKYVLIKLCVVFVISSLYCFINS